MRITLTKILSAFISCTVVLITWTMLRPSQKEKFTQTCHHPEVFQAELHKLADRTHKILKTLDLTHFLCFGSLWGQIRMSHSLPWEADIEICVLNEELAKLDEVLLIRTFKKHGLELSYNSAEGMYSVKDSLLTGGQVQLIVFEEDQLIKMYRRVGWKRRMLPPDCEGLPSLQCFPPRLIATPLPQKEFGKYIIPVPREGIELQKYHYQNNWWKEVLPKNC